MHSKTAVFGFLVATAVALGALFSSLYYYDPLQLYHRSWLGNEGRFHAEMRQQAAGAINSYPFDSMILGTSLLENTSAVEASAVLSGDFVNLSLSGGNFYERDIILRHALRRKKLQQVIYSLDFVYIGAKRENPLYPTSNFDYLYDRNPLNDIRVYLNAHYFECLSSFSTSDACLGARRGLDRPNAWMDRPGQKARFGGLKNWLKASDHPQIHKALKTISESARQARRGERRQSKMLDALTAQSLEYVEEFIVQVAKANPDTVFHFVFPPYSRVRYAIWAQVERPNFEIYKSVVQYLAERSESLANMNVYGWDDRAFPDDIARYKDTVHFDPEINSWMLQAIAGGDGLLRAREVPAYLERAESLALDFDLAGLGRRIDRYLKRKPPGN